jgi:hypothetical protein
VFNTFDEIFPIGNQLPNHLGQHYQSHAALLLLDAHSLKKLNARSASGTFPSRDCNNHGSLLTIRKIHWAAGDSLLDRRLGSA